MNRTISVLLIGVIAAACANEKPKAVQEKVPVTVATAQASNVPIQIHAIGNVQPLSNVDVKALAGGQLTKVWFQEGADVRKGALLFTIDPRPYQAALAQAQANLERDEAALRNATSEAARYADLIKKDYVTHEEYDRFTSAAAAAKAVVASDRAALENERLQLSYCEIRSPMDGRTGALMVHPGNIVKANDTTPLVTINQISPVYVQFAVPESQLASFRSQGSLKDITVTATAQGGGAPIAQGKMSFVDNTVNSTTGTISLKALFPNETRSLWPGQYVTVAATLGEHANAVVVPSQAVQTGQNGQYVYVVNGDSSVEMRDVKAADAIDQKTIIESGLTAGETVVTDGQLRLTAKSHVEVKGTESKG